MTYRERRAAKAAKLQEWAQGREVKADALLVQNAPYRDDIAFNTQPGHIPERARVIAREDRAFEHLSKADDMRERASGIEAQLDHAIYSDDPNAIQRLQERIKELTVRRDRMKAINAQIKRGAGWETRITLTEDEKTDLIFAAKFSGKAGYPGYALTNLSGNIRRQQQRLASLTKEATNA